MSSTYEDVKTITLSSRDAIQNNGSYLSDVYFKFTGLLIPEKDIIGTRISVLNAQIPYSFYNINVYNNVLSFLLGATPYTITLTRGNYNATTLISEIQTKLSSIGVSTLTFSISSITGVVTIAISSGTLTLVAATSTLLGVLGFQTSTNTVSSGATLAAPYPLNLLGILKINITSYELSLLSYSSSGGTSNILACIPIEASNFGVILYDNISNIQTIMKNDILDGFDLQLVGDDGNLINFNGVHWSITLALTIIRKDKNPIKTDFRQVVQPILKLVDVETQLVDTLANQGGGEVSQPDQNSSVSQTGVNPNSEVDQNLEPDDETDLELLFYNHGQTL